MTRTYAFAHEIPERLAGFQATWDPGTQALLERLGVGDGWRCLEVGAGAGSIAAWLAERVRPDGSVLATDIDTVHLESLAGGLLDVRRHDLVADELPVASFDLVHARSVVSWLEPDEALGRLVGALAPGGWLLVEDCDWSIGGPAEASPASAKAHAAILDLLAHVGYDPYLGRTHLRRLEEAGLEDAGSEGRCALFHGGSLQTAFERFSMLSQRERLIGSGRLTQAEFEENQRHLADPDARVLTPVMYAAWGRRPA